MQVYNHSHIIFLESYYIRANYQFVITYRYYILMYAKNAVIARDSKFYVSRQRKNELLMFIGIDTTLRIIFIWRNQQYP